jgi:soluble lytic murein transglycosylase-like protein
MAVPLIESGFKNLLPAGAGAAGIWQFMPQTARNFGLRVDEKVDQRLDIARETDAGLRLLGALHLRFSNWPLALAGYNQGENHVQWAIDEAGTRDPWELAAQGKLNDYGANIVAGVIVIRNPSLVQP